MGLIWSGGSLTCFIGGSGSQCKTGNWVLLSGVHRVTAVYLFFQETMFFLVPSSRIFNSFKTNLEILPRNIYRRGRVCYLWPSWESTEWHWNLVSGQEEPELISFWSCLSLSLRGKLRILGLGDGEHVSSPLLPEYSFPHPALQTKLCHWPGSVLEDLSTKAFYQPGIRDVLKWSTHQLRRATDVEAYQISVNSKPTERGHWTWQSPHKNTPWPPRERCGLL